MSFDLPDDPRPRRYDHTHGARGEFKSGFKFTLGVVFALLFVFVLLPVLLCAGCFGFSVFGVSKVREEAARRKQEAEARADPDPQPEAAPDPPNRRPAGGGVVALADPSGFVVLADTEATWRAFAKAEAEKNQGIILDFFRADTVTRTPAGSEAKVLELGPELAKVTMTGGPHRGRTGYVAVSAIPKPPPEEPKAAARPEKKDGPRVRSASELADARDEVIEHGGMRVWVASAVVGKVKVESFGEGESKNDQLKVLVKLKNLSRTKKVDYKGWGGETFVGGDKAGLRDNFGNTYKRVTFGLAAKVEGQVIQEAVYPDKTAEDLLVFEPPVDAAKNLELELPAGNFGGSGTLRFCIPRAMWSGK